ncbi:MAG TPA: urease accessory protein UreH [Nitrospiria bacterium]
MIDPGFMTVLAVGFVLGMKHALDADHVVAVSTIVSKDRSFLGSSLVGLFWGIGHTLTLLGVGFVILMLKIVIPDKVALGMELAVGIMLVFLGGVVAAGLIREHLHLHPHRHEEGETHLHLHTHPPVETHAHSHAIRRGYRSMAVGMVHGLAGSAALMFLVVPGLHSTAERMAYIIIFGAGSMLGMMLVTMVISLPFVYTGMRFNRLSRIMTAVAGIASIGLGTILIYEIGFVKGLFL